MNLAHLCVYEEGLAAPVLAALADGQDGTQAVESAFEARFEPEARALSASPAEESLDRLRAVRSRQAELVRSFDDERFNTSMTPLWQRPGADLDPPGWVSAKTVQHTWEHGSTIFQIALFA